MNKKNILIILIAVVLLAGLALWLGLRGDSLNVRSGDDVTVFAPNETDVIVIKGSATNANTPDLSDALKYTVTESSKVGLKLDNGPFDILADRGDDFYPWVKQIAVLKSSPTEVRPFFFKKTTELQITDNSKAKDAFATGATLPTEKTPLKADNGNLELYVSGSSMFLKWTGEVKDMPEFLCPGENVEDCRLQSVFTFSTPVENVAFYGKENELMLADIGPAVIAIEFDRRGTQNLQPVYTSTTPIAFRIIDGDIYISEAGVVKKVVLD